MISGAMQESFLSALKEMEPDVCITAAYGNILPQKFLDIPSCGTTGCPVPVFPFCYPSFCCYCTMHKNCLMFKHKQSVN